ncbi:hypothetical protein F8M41_011272 [Gigaspora margarita]|uniref:Uncharacterized protein n=1 Tax=Gigaspora margarita TaxID=4874 RepID=A0A8H3X0J6_GIGMA|nr:hypothetical protein F8M41_011272 [Gigaspora margarita]
MSYLTAYADQEAEINDIACTEVDYFEVGDFVECEIRELADNAEANEIVDVPYQGHLLVRVDVTIQDMTTKEAAELVIIDIENGDDYSWK